MFYKKLLTLLLISICTSIISLEYSGKLTLYVHPRYVVFSYAMALIAAAISLFSLYSSEGSNQSDVHKLSFITIGIVFAILLLPARSLSQQTAQNRLQSSQTANKLSPVSYDAFSQDFTHFDIQDWTTYLANKPALEQIVGKKAQLTAFVFDANNTRYLARFQLSCCTVDATPLTIEVSKNDISAILESGDWYEVTGSFDYIDDSYLFVMSDARAVDEPEDPYVF